MIKLSPTLFNANTQQYRVRNVKFAKICGIRQQSNPVINMCEIIYVCEICHCNRPLTPPCAIFASFDFLFNCFSQWQSSHTVANLTFTVHCNNKKVQQIHKVKIGAFIKK